ncbi:DUF1127 domain-containing protein [uncultured Devosia sp.]|uniref:DUF1127 domain-containing protein n=1 Tax=uncultured Devosia sp. TaxID=211434 RepID=UPI002608B4ED|nr:DUF1127 domain-containing protein [uncultured Devosia sp.]
MALSLSGERSVVAGSHVNPARALFAWFAQAKRDRARQKALRELLSLDPALLKDIGVSRSDVVDALTPQDGRTAGMILNAARARNAQR